MGEVDLVAAFSHHETIETAQQWFRESRAKAHVVAVDFGSLGVDGTPTLLWLDSEVRVRQVWLGKMSTTDQAKLVSALDGCRSNAVCR